MSDILARIGRRPEPQGPVDLPLTSLIQPVAGAPGFKGEASSLTPQASSLCPAPIAVTMPQAASMLGVCERQFRAMVGAGAMPPGRKIGRSGKRWLVEELVEWARRLPH